MRSDTSHRQPENNQPIPSLQTMPYPDDEIDLREVFAILWRRRKFIGLGVLLFVVAAVAIVFTMPNVYRVKALVSPGIVSREPGGKVTFSNSLEGAKGQIEAGAYDTRLAVYLEEKYPEMRYSSKALRVSIPKNSNTLLITYDTINPDFGMSALSYLIDWLKEEDAQIIKPYVEGLQSEIDTNKKAIADYQTRVDLASANLKNRIKAKKDIESQITNAIKSTDEYLSHGVKSLASSDLSEDSLYKALIYNNTVIQNRQVISDLKKELNDINAKIDLLEKQQQSDLESSRELMVAVDKSTRSIKNIIPFQEIIPVMTEEGLVGPKRKLIVMMSFVCGAFIMIFVAFFVEFLKPSQK